MGSSPLANVVEESTEAPSAEMPDKLYFRIGEVAQLVGYISEQTAYHHGEASLETTIVGMAQDFVGSNNVNLLFPSGQFGTRLQGGTLSLGLLPGRSREDR